MPNPDRNVERIEALAAYLRQHPEEYDQRTPGPGPCGCLAWLCRRLFGDDDPLPPRGRGPGVIREALGVNQWTASRMFWRKSTRDPCTVAAAEDAATRLDHLAATGEWLA